MKSLKRLAGRSALFGAAAFLALLPTSANASTVQFGPSGWVDQNGAGSPLAYVSVLTDTVANTVNVDVDLASGQLQTGDLLVIGLDGFDFPDPTAVSSVITNTGDGVTQLCYDTLSCGGGGNFTGGTQNALLSGGDWDLLLRIGVSGMTSGLNTQVAFDLSAVGLDAKDITAMGLRVQSFGDLPSGGGSLKLYNFNPVVTQDFPPPVPLPAALWLIISALGSLGIFGWRKQKLATA